MPLLPLLNRGRPPMMLTVALLASACHGPGPTSTPLPPVADVEAATEPKPLPPVTIATDAKANAQYSADVESWGERVRSAGVRVCEWLNAAVKTADYQCGRAR